MKLKRIYATTEDANAAAWELMEAGIGGGRTRVIPGERPAVEVDPAFGTARSAITILEKRRAGDTAPAQVIEEADPALAGGGAGGDDAAPFSRALGMPVLTSGDGFISSRFGWKLLSHSPSPFSDLFGWKVLLNEKPRHAAKEFEVKV
jgi:hypothetical protein